MIQRKTRVLKTESDEMLENKRCTISQGSKIPGISSQRKGSSSNDLSPDRVIGTGLEDLLELLGCDNDGLVIVPRGDAIFVLLHTKPRRTSTLTFSAFTLGLRKPTGKSAYIVGNR